MHKRWVVKPVKEKKNYDFLQELQTKVLGMCEGTGEIPEAIIEVELPDNIASEPAPDKQDLIDRHRSRFATWLFPIVFLYVVCFMIVYMYVLNLLLERLFSYTQMH